MIYLQMILVTLGCLFFIVGTLGLLRFKDTFSRIHAITKADNLGLGLLVLGLLPSAGSFSLALKLILIWILVLAASAVASYLVAHYVQAHHSGSPCEKPRPTAKANEEKI